MTYEYYVLVFGAWAPEIASQHGDDAMREIPSAAWEGDDVPRMARTIQDRTAFDAAEEMRNEYH